MWAPTSLQDLCFITGNACCNLSGLKSNTHTQTHTPQLNAHARACNLTARYLSPEEPSTEFGNFIADHELQFYHLGVQNARVMPSMATTVSEEIVVAALKCKSARVLAIATPTRKCTVCRRDCRPLCDCAACPRACASCFAGLSSYAQVFIRWANTLMYSLYVRHPRCLCVEIHAAIANRALTHSHTHTHHAYAHIVSTHHQAS